MLKYVVKDRTTSQNWAISVVNGEIVYTSTTDTAQSEPVFQDYVNTGTFWRYFIDDSQDGWETIVSTSDNPVYLYDTVEKRYYRITISDGVFGITEERPQVKEFIKLIACKLSRYTVGDNRLKHYFENDTELDRSLQLLKKELSKYLESSSTIDRHIKGKTKVEAK